MSAKHFIITGDVQGVFFRANTERKAQEYHLTGWVRNTSDGAVAVHAEGRNTNIDLLEQWLHEGPAAAQVRNIEAKEIPEEGFNTFTILETT